MAALSCRAICTSGRIAQLAATPARLSLPSLSARINDQPMTRARLPLRHFQSQATRHCAPVPMVHPRKIHNELSREPEAELEVQCYLVRSPSSPKLAVQFQDGCVSTFDNQFLIDHCRCPSCFHPQTKQRLKPLSEASPRVTISNFRVDETNIHVIWETGHESIFPVSFLRRASYDPPLEQRQEDHRKLLWGSSIASNAPSVSYETLMPDSAGTEESERGVLAWLDKVAKYGFCFVTGVPPSPNATEELVRRISHIRETHYGGFWDFTADMAHGDLAYSSQALPAHTDTTYFTDPAGLQIFHLLAHRNGSGGESLLVDGFHAAALLAKNHEQAYDILSRLPVPFHASGSVGTILRPPISQPILRHDHHGRLSQVRWNNEDRGILGDGWKPNEVRQWYEAAQQFENLCGRKSTEFWFQLHPGTVVVIDNWRVMHGRASFTGQRRMCGAYVGADDWRSRHTSLAKRFRSLTETAKEDDIWSQGW